MEWTGVALVWIIGGAFWWYWTQYRKRQQAIAESNTRLVQYRSAEEANVGIAAMAKDGWSIQSMDTTDGHINVGRTATATILTGGLALFLGGSRSPGKITILYEKLPEPPTLKVVKPRRPRKPKAS